MIIRTPFLFGNVWAITINSNLIIAIGEKIDTVEWLLPHEQVHQKQMREIGAVTFWFKYLTSKSFRLAVEVEAYHDSYKRVPGQLYSFASMLSNSYSLSLNLSDAMVMIQRGSVE